MNAMKPLALAALFAVSSLSFADDPTKVLLPGDKAPAMTVSEWVKGTKVDKFEGGKVYVVEFWATWCGPCKETIPHLTELQKKYKGKVHFTGVSVWERGEDIPGQVKQFVSSWGNKMDYAVAIDTYTDPTQPTSGLMSQNWMFAAKRTGIPSAFIVKDGVVQWVGHPTALDKPLADVLAGSFDLDAQREEYKKFVDAELKKEEVLTRIAATETLFKSGKKEFVAKEIAEILAMGSYTYSPILNAMMQEVASEEGNKEYAVLLADEMVKAINDPIAMFYASQAYQAVGDMKKTVDILEKAVKSFDGGPMSKDEAMKPWRATIVARLEEAKKLAKSGG